MKKEHEDKMADLARREEEAKKQVQFFFSLFLLFNRIETKGYNLGTNV